MRVTFTAEIIADLKRRVIAHNEAARLSGSDMTGLAQLKKAYIAGHRGQSPAASALDAVDRHLEKLAKAERFDESKHPRAKGKFASKGGRSLADLVPADKQEHQQLQEESAGYHALTTQLVPEYRGQLIGRLARQAIAAGVGAGTVYSLLRGKPNGLVRRASGSIGANAVRYSAGVAIKHGIPLTARAWRAIPLKATAKWTKEAAEKTGGRGADRVSGWGRKAGHVIADVPSRAGKGVMWTASRGKDSKLRTARRVGAFAGMALIPAAAVNSALEATVDPESIGRGYDSVSYRTVEKVALMPEFEAARQAMMAVIRAEGNDLEKAAGLYSRVGQALFGSLAAAGGAAIGSAAVRRVALRTLATGAAAAAGGAAADEGEKLGGKKGNPYHDAHGRFTSHDAAHVGAAVVGAALAGGAVLAAIRTHNLRAFRRAVAGIMERKSSAIREAAEGFRGDGPHVELHRTRSGLVKQAMADDADYAAQKDTIRKYGRSASVHYAAKVHEAVNHKIAEELLPHTDKVKIPTGRGKSGANWTPIDDVVSGSTQARMTQAHEILLRNLDEQPSKGVERMIEDLPDAAQTKIKALLGLRKSASASVASDIAGHEAHIDSLRDATDTAEKAHQTAVGASVSARAAQTANTDEKQAEAFTKAVDAADANEETARKAFKAAQTKLEGIQAKGAQIKNPVTGKPIPAATEVELGARERDLATKAKARAEATVDRKIEGVRKAHLADLVRQHNAEAAAEAVLGVERGGVPKSVKAAATKYAAVHKAMVTQEGLVASAAAKRAEAESALEAIPKNGRQKFNPNNPEHIKIKERATEAAKEFDQAHTELLARQTAIHEPAADFVAAMERDGEVQAKRVGRIPGWFTENLKHDLNLATAGANTTAAQLLKMPGARTLKNFVQSQAAKTPDRLSGAQEAVRDTYRELFMRKKSEGKYVHHLPKVVANLGLLGAVIESGRALSDFAHAKILGTDEEAGKAKLPTHYKIESPIDPITGAGYTAISVADPENKGDHLLLWGQRYDRNANVHKLYAGGRMSTLRQGIREVQSREGGSGNGLNRDSYPTKDVQNLPGSLKKDIDQAIGQIPKGKLLSFGAGAAGSVQVRDQDAGGQHAVAQKLVDHIKGDLNRGGGQDKIAALRAIFSTQGRILTTRQAYELLTGFKTNGEKAKNQKVSVFGDGAGFGSMKDAGDVAEAAAETLPGLVSAHKNDADVKMALHRAVAVIGRAKGLTRESVASLHDIITPSTKTAEAPNPKPAEPPPRQEERAQKREEAPDQSRPSGGLPPHWAYETMADAADQAADDVGEYHEGSVSTAMHAGIKRTIERLAMRVHHSDPDLLITEHEGVAIAHDIVRHHLEAAGAEEGQEGIQAVLEELHSGNVRHFSDDIEPHLESFMEEREYHARHNTKEAFDGANDLEKMLESFGLGKSGDDAGLTPIQRAVKGGLEGAVDVGGLAASRKLTQSSDSPTQSFLAPGRALHELGGALAADSAWQLALKFAQRFNPATQVASAFLQEAPQAAGGLAARVRGALTTRNILTHGGALAASTVASTGAGSGIDALTGANYHPGEDDPEGLAGRLAGSIGGDLIGATAGKKLLTGEAATAGAAALGRTGFGRIAGNVVSRAALAISGRALGTEGGAALGTLLGPVGTIVGGAAGSWLAGEAGSKIADYFAGHDPDQVQRATSRYMGPRVSGRGISAPSAPRVPGAQPSRMPGAGGRGGDPYHDQIGRFSSAGGGA